MRRHNPRPAPGHPRNNCRALPNRQVDPFRAPLCPPTAPPHAGMACPASTTAARSNLARRGIDSAGLLGARSFCRNPLRPITPPLIFLVSYHFQMVRIDAAPVPTLVVNLLFTRNEAVFIGVHHPMHRDSLTIQAHPRIIAAPPIARIRAGPLPAIAPQGRTKDGFNPRLNLSLNRSPPISHEAPPKKRDARLSHHQRAPSLTGRTWGPLAGAPAPGQRRRRMAIRVLQCFELRP